MDLFILKIQIRFSYPKEDKSKTMKSHVQVESCKAQVYLKNTRQDVNVNDISKYQKNKYIGLDSLDIKTMTYYFFIFRYFISRTPK